MSIIVLDTETTGLDPEEDQLVELAALEIGQPNYFSKLCNPGRSIGVEAMATHHITEEMIAFASSPEQVVIEMLQQLDTKQHIFVAHNAKFDRAFIEPLLPSFVRPTWICTYRCALKAFPDAPRHTNQVLRYWLGLNPPVPEGLAPHRALYDIIVTAEIFKVLQTRLSIDQMIEITNKPILLPRVPFGKHAGKTWDQVDYGYLRWILQNITDNDDLVFTARHWMNRNGR